MTETPRALVLRNAQELIAAVRRGPRNALTTAAADRLQIALIEEKARQPTEED